MKKTILVLTLAALAGAGAPNSFAGDREWATAGKILTGVIAGTVIAKSLEPAPVYYETRTYYSAPVVVTPPPVYVHPAPVHVRPAPVYVPPAPVYASPAPVYVAPAPVVVHRPPPVIVHRPVYVAPPPPVSVHFSFGRRHYYPPPPAFCW